MHSSTSAPGAFCAPSTVAGIASPLYCRFQSTSSRSANTGVCPSNVFASISSRWISIDSSLPRIDFEEEDTLTFEHKGVEATGTVEAVEDRAMPGVAGTTRLTLAPA